jgi:3-hydroxyisobutyrate dehydrogenase
MGANGTVLLMAATRTVAFLGTGLMGFPMARNLARAGFPVRAWNRSREKAEPLASFGVDVCKTPEAALQGAGTLVTMLADGPATAAAVDGVIHAELLWLQMGTVGVDWIQRLAHVADRAGAAFVDAPVLGTVGPAEKGELLVIASGAEEAIDAAATVFDTVGRRTIRLGAAGQSSRLKLVMNYWILAQTALAGEALALAEALGVGGKTFLETIAGTVADSPYVQARGPRMLAGDFESPNFKLVLAHKDLALAEEAGASAGLELTIARAVVEEMARAIERGYGEADFTSVMEATRAGSA